MSENYVLFHLPYPQCMLSEFRPDDFVPYRWHHTLGFCYRYFSTCFSFKVPFFVVVVFYFVLFFNDICIVLLFAKVKNTSIFFFDFFFLNFCFSVMKNKLFMIFNIYLIVFVHQCNSCFPAATESIGSSESFLCMSLKIPPNQGSQLICETWLQKSVGSNPHLISSIPLQNFFLGK